MTGFGPAARKPKGAAMPRKTKIFIAPAPRAGTTDPTLSALCSEAAAHVAKARIALFDESVDPESALAHLDDAIACLKRILAHNRPDRSQRLAQAPLGLRPIRELRREPEFRLGLRQPAAQPHGRNGAGEPGGIVDLHAHARERGLAMRGLEPAGRDLGEEAGSGSSLPMPSTKS